MKKLFETPGGWISVWEENGYYWSQRKGVDSIAVVPFKNDGDITYIYIHEEYNNAHLMHRSINKGAIGGSMLPGDDPVKVAIKEAREEGGFEITEEDLIYCGKIFCTTQSSEHVYLFAANVTGIQQQQLNLEPSEIDGKHKNYWVPFSKKLYDYEDPRFVVTLTRLMAK